MTGKTMLDRLEEEVVGREFNNGPLYPSYKVNLLNSNEVVFEYQQGDNELSYSLPQFLASAIPVPQTHTIPNKQSLVELIQEKQIHEDDVLKYQGAKILVVGVSHGLYYPVITVLRSDRAGVKSIDELRYRVDERGELDASRLTKLGAGESNFYDAKLKERGL